MKKIITFTLIFALILTLCSCSKEPKPPKIIPNANKNLIDIDTVPVSQEKLQEDLNFTTDEDMYMEYVSYDQLNKIIKQGNAFIYIGDIKTSQNKEVIQNLLVLANDTNYPLIYFNINDPDISKLKEKWGKSDLDETFVFLKDSQVGVIEKLDKYNIEGTTDDTVETGVKEIYKKLHNLYIENVAPPTTT